MTVLGVVEVDERRGVLLRMRRGDKKRRLLAEEVWATKEERERGGAERLPVLGE